MMQYRDMANVAKPKLAAPAVRLPYMWEDINPPSQPPARWNSMMAFDGTHIILFGGNGDPIFENNDTWRWTGSNWEELLPADSPPVRGNASMAFDGTNIILFGGIRSGPYLDDTWKWTGSNWEELSPTNKPPSRFGASMAFDGKNIILFGGNGIPSCFGDTWKLTATGWEEITSSKSPSPRAYASMAFDGTNIILFGGVGRGGMFMNDTWKWNGTEWIDVTPTTATPPPPRYSASITFDGANIILFGGYAGDPLNDTWKLTASGWEEITTATTPSLRTAASMAFDGKYIILFGGQDYDGNIIRDTWRLRSLSSTAPQNLVVTAQTTSKKVMLVVSWDPPAYPGENATITSYLLNCTAAARLSGYKSAQTLPPTPTTATITNITPDTLYTVSLTARNSNGFTSAPSTYTVRSGVPTNWNN